MPALPRVLFASGLSALFLFAGARATSQPRSRTECDRTCADRQQQATTRCARNASCEQDARFERRRCDARCISDPVERCRTECGIASDECDARCRTTPDERGCLRRCGSRYHISCPRECAEVPPLR